MLMKRGFSIEALAHIAENTRKAQELELSDADLVEVDDMGNPIDPGAGNLDQMVRLQDEQAANEWDREVPEWMAGSNAGGELAEGMDPAVKLQETISLFLPEGSEFEVEAISELAGEQMTQFGDGFSDPFWAAVGYSDQQGSADFKTAIDVASKAAEANIGSEVAQLIGSGTDPIEALSSLIMFG